MSILRVIVIAVIFFFVSRFLQRMFGPARPRRSSAGATDGGGGRSRAQDPRAVNAEYEEIDDRP